MPLTLVLGPANSAKAGEVLGAYGAAARRGAVLVVPTARDAGAYARELAGSGVVLGASVLTFAGLAREIAFRTGYSERRVSAFQRERVLERAIREAQLTTLAESASADGFASAAGELIAELQRALVSPQRFSQALTAWAAEDPRRAGYARDLAALYRGYLDELGRAGRVDGDLYAWRALDALRVASHAWGTDAVFVYGFDDLHPLERDAVETLARVVDTDVTVSLTYEPGRAALGARAETVEELRPLARSVLELPPLDDHYEPSARRALHHLERHLFEAGAERIDPGPAIRLLEAGGERAEVELVAAEVLALLAAGVPGDEIVVAYRSADRVAPLVERVFGAAGIPVASDRRVPLAHTAVGRGLIGLARCALVEDATASDLLAYLRTPGVLQRPEVADALEAAVRRDGLRTAAQARERIGWELDELESLRRDPVGELARQARRLLATPHRGEAVLLTESEALDAAAVRALLRALAELQDLGEVPPAAELIELMAAIPVSFSLPPRPGAVLLAEPLAIRARRFRAVFVCGLQEGEFPRPGSPEPFLSDERRRELAGAAGLRLPFREDGLDRERYLFYACVSRATEQLVLSYRSSDEEGNMALASPFIADVVELLDPAWPSRRRTRLLADVVWAPEDAPTARDRVRALAALAGAEAAAPGAAAEEPPVRRLGEAALAHVRHREVLSAGALEKFADCPVRWLVESELRPIELRPDPEPLARGNYMHAVLEQLLTRLDAPITEATLPDAYRVLDEVLAEFPAPVAAGRGSAVRDGAVRSIAADLRRYLAHEARAGAGWAHAGLELRFGFDETEGSLPALVLSDGTQLRGIVDRVDEDGRGHAIVRDYKTGRARPEWPAARWGEDRQLQVALYMLVVRELVGLQPVAGVYQPLSGDDLRARGLFLRGDAELDRGFVANDAREAEELEEVLRAAEARAVAIAAALREGTLTPCPETCSRHGCAHPGICRST
jgi:ATP-dependent helicase/DNAse subunit B